MPAILSFLNTMETTLYVCGAHPIKLIVLT